jgi:hypothetical protein
MTRKAPKAAAEAPSRAERVPGRRQSRCWFPRECRAVRKSAPTIVPLGQVRKLLVALWLGSGGTEVDRELARNRYIAPAYAASRCTRWIWAALASTAQGRASACGVVEYRLAPRAAICLLIGAGSQGSIAPAATITASRRRLARTCWIASWACSTSWARENRAASALIWRAFCQGGRHEFPAFRWLGTDGCGRLGGWRSGLLCATRVMLIYADPGGRRTMVRRGEPLSRIERGQPGLVAHSAFADSPRVPGRHRPSRRDEDVIGVGYSIWVIAQQNPASSRAAATAMIVRRFARCSRRAQTRCSRRCADHAIAIASGGWPF